MKKREVVRVGVTGHRPARTAGAIAADQAAAQAMEALTQRYAKLVVVTGGAMGFDHVMAQECARRRIPYEIVLPCPIELFTAYWTLNARMMLGALCRRAVDVVVLREDLMPGQVTPAVYHERNAHIVQCTDQLVAYWDGRQSGGTWWTIAHAMGADKPVWNACDNLRPITAKEVA